MRIKKLTVVTEDDKVLTYEGEGHIMPPSSVDHLGLPYRKAIDARIILPPEKDV